MTGTGITQTAGLLMGAVGVSAAGSAAGSTAGDGFSQIMNRTKDTAGQLQSSPQNSQTAAARTPVKVDRNTVKDAGNQTADQGFFPFAV